MEHFSDEQFPAEISSISFSKTSSENDVKWKRPCELCTAPKLRKKNEISFPVQGLLGDCWLMCAFYTLARNEKARQHVFQCENQDLFGLDYTGKITVQLWINGQWNDVTIDDFLPVTEKKGHLTLLYGKCTDETQFWAPLLEKAFAKVYGCYESLNSGQISEGYLMLHAGYTWKETFPKFVERDNDKIRTLVQKISLILESGNSDIHTKSFVFLSTHSDLNNHQLITLDQNHGSLHCYCIKDLDQLNGSKITLWNPWRKTNHKPNEEIQICDIPKYNMTLTYATLNLNKIFNCSHRAKAIIHEKILSDKWVACHSSGGNSNTKTFHRNPQFILSLETCQSPDPGYVHLTLFQTPKRQWGSRKELLQAIAIHVFRIPESTSTRLNHEQLNRLNNQIVNKTEYDYDQIVSSTFPIVGDQGSSLSFSHYLIIPSTYTPNVNETFHLRASTSFAIKSFNELIHTNSSFTN